MSTELVERLRAHVAELEERLERESGDLRYAKQALDRETARALKFGKRITALTAKVHDVEASNTRLLSLIADIREASGVGALHELPLVIDRIVDERDVATAKVALLTEALRPFDGLATVVLSEAPPNADFIVVYTDSSGKKWAMRLDELRAARRALSEPDKNET